MEGEKEKEPKPSNVLKFFEEMNKALAWVPTYPPECDTADIDELVYLEPRDKIEAELTKLVDNKVEGLVQLELRKKAEKGPAKRKYLESAREELVHTEQSILEEYNSKPLKADEPDIFRKAAAKQRKAVNYISPPRPDGSRFSETIPDDRPSMAEVVFTFSFYHSSQNLKIQSFQLLGSQTLLDLKNVFECHDYRPIDDSCPHSSFFFIGDCFYNNDAPFHSNGALKYPVDLTVKIREWLENRGPKSVKYPTGSMTFDIDNVQCNYKYLYCHRGDCEHFLVVESIVQYNPYFHPHRRVEFPSRVYESKKLSAQCRICEREIATCVTWRDWAAPESPCHFCRVCYQALHYDKEGKLTSDHYLVEKDTFTFS